MRLLKETYPIGALGDLVASWFLIVVESWLVWLGIFEKVMHVSD